MLLRKFHSTESTPIEFFALIKLLWYGVEMRKKYKIINILIVLLKKSIIIFSANTYINVTPYMHQNT